MMKVGSLFSGIGGFDLGLERAGCEILWQVENDDYCRAVLRKHWPYVPCHYDIRAIDWRYVPPVDLVCGGFPCQPFSCAGKRRGAEDDRYLWPEVVRCLEILQPTWGLFENVPGLIGLGLDQVLTDLESLGYETGTLCVPACAVDAPHLRQRLWIVAYAGRERRQQDARGTHGDEGQDEGRSSAQTDELDGHGEGRRARDVADTESQRCGEARTDSQRSTERTPRSFMADADTKRRHGWTGQQRTGRREQFTDGGQADADTHGEPARRAAKPRQEYRDWETEPAMGELVNGVSGRLVRFGGRVVKRAAQRKEKLKALGNAIVPKIAEEIGRMILTADGGGDGST